MRSSSSKAKTHNVSLPDQIFSLSDSTTYTCSRFVLRSNDLPGEFRDGSVCGDPQHTPQGHERSPCAPPAEEAGLGGSLKITIYKVGVYRFFLLTTYMYIINYYYYYF